MIEAVLFDLDDTLFEQRRWLEGAWRAVAAVGEGRGVDAVALHAALLDVASEGSGRGGIIDRALARVGAGPLDVAPFVEAFRAHRPRQLPLYPGVREMLEDLRRQVRVGLVTDGDPRIQRAKLDAVGLAGSFDVEVLSDALGRARRKPHPAPLRTALAVLGVDPARAAFVGDRPDKDVAGALAAGMLAVRVRSGEYAAVPDDPRPWRSVPDVTGAIRALRPLLAPVPSGLSVL